MVMPLARALGGRRERNRRGALALAEKGLNLVVTLVINRVIIVTAPWGGGLECLVLEVEPGFA